jgi:hypothetical protein
MNQLFNVCLLLAISFAFSATTNKLIKLEPKDSCRPGWVNVQKQCYYVSNFSLEWQDARAWCHNEHSRLFVIDSQEQFQAVMDVIPKRTGYYYWVSFLLSVFS